ncbi:MAG: hypothetical protein KGK17_01940 [Betaproteobacteria bacterium]|nr:hypothetical protein [Betaproteobacteria bacterium]
MAAVIPVIAALGALASVASSVKGLASGGGGGGTGQQDALRAAIARRTPDMMAQTGGGAAPQFTANLSAQDAGLPGMNMDALKELQSQFPGAGGGGT